jgi:hypothetical protein
VFAVDQVRVDAIPVVTEKGEAVRVTVGAGGGGVIGGSTIGGGKTGGGVTGAGAIGGGNIGGVIGKGIMDGGTIGGSVVFKILSRNVAATTCDRSIISTQLPVPEQSPDQKENV